MDNLNNKYQKLIGNNKNNISDIKFDKNLSNNSFSKYWLIDTFCIFKSINDIFCLVYTNNNNSLICHNIIDNIIIIEIKYCHCDYTTNFRYYFDKENNRDLIISISSEDNNIKLWNANNWECLLNLKKINKYGWIYAACFLNYNNQNLIVATNDNNIESGLELIKIYNFNGIITKTINDSKDRTFFINTYHDNKTNKIYIIKGSQGYIKSYDYNNNILYKKYNSRDSRAHFYIINYLY